MTNVAAHLDALSPAAARESLRRCCGSDAWVEQMMRLRPFGSEDRLFSEADRVWRNLDERDWIDAFTAHPRIGERVEESRAGGAWSRTEQAGMDSARPETARALAAGNEQYESRFGHVFLICADGRSAEEMLAALRGRLNNDLRTERRIAADEQALITRLRLRKLVDG